MTLSIIIVNWNTRELLKKCIDSIIKNAPNFDFEIIIVDNASTDGSQNMIDTIQDSFEKPIRDRIKEILNQNNLGFAKANNQAIKKAKGDYILLLNPDTEIINNTLEKTVDYIKKHEEIGILGCKLLNPDRTTQPSVRKFPTLGSQLIILLKLHNLFPSFVSKYYMTDFDYSRSQIVDQVMGAYFLTTKKVLEKIGDLDEKYWIWFEEVDFCKKAKLAGFDTFYFADAEIIHIKAQAFNQVLGIKKQVYLNNSMIHYFKKYHSIFSVFILILFFPISLLLAIIVDIIKKIIPVKKNKKL